MKLNQIFNSHLVTSLDTFIDPLEEGFLLEQLLLFHHMHQMLLLDPKLYQEVVHLSLRLGFCSVDVELPVDLVVDPVWLHADLLALVHVTVL